MIQWWWLFELGVAGGVGTLAGHVIRQRFRKIEDRLDDLIDQAEGLIDAAETGFIAKLRRQVDAQRQHGLMLWPRPWEGGRPLTQVEEIVSDMSGWTGHPLDPFEQREQMQADAERLLESYRPPAPQEDDDAPS